MTYVDTSVLVAYYVEEPLSEKAESEIRGDSENTRPTISQLTVLEFYSALSRKVRMNELQQTDGNKIINLLNAHIRERRFTELLLKPKHYQRACEWLSRFDLPLRSLDALHLALTNDAGATFLTADSHLAESAAALGIDVRLLET